MYKPKLFPVALVFLLVLALGLSACGTSVVANTDPTPISKDTTVDDFISTLINHNTPDSLKLFNDEAEVILINPVNLSSPGYKGRDQALQTPDQIAHWLKEFNTQAKNLQVDYTQYQVSGSKANWSMSYTLITPISTELKVEASFEAVLDSGSIKSLTVSNRKVEEYICNLRAGSGQCVVKASTTSGV
jgi:hypothetical protein